MKTYQGEVVSDKMDKTIVVIVKRRAKHKKYKKIITKTKKFHVHDEKNSAKIGDEVVFADSKPFSKTKKFKLVEIKKKG
ncbi:MAG: 30S ribosomal protein S17 [Bacilli bacterium]|nr:30S ribosomal protein S17 [Bacilli bacterium]